MTDELKLGLNLGYWLTPGDATEVVLAAERLGYDSIWTAESCGSDALTPLAWYGARTSRIKLGTSVVQISARTPAATAMAAVTLDHLSGGRLMLGVGASGPQVVEGWYGVPFAQPLARTREYVDLLRVMWRRQRPARNTGAALPAPLPARHRARQAAQAEHPAAARGHPGLSRRGRPEERGTRGRDRRRLAVAVHPSGEDRPRSTAAHSPRHRRASTSPPWSASSSPTTSPPRCGPRR